MIKEPPSLGRVLAMVIFALSCFGLVIFLWLSFGGGIPFNPQGYRFEAAFPDASVGMRLIMRIILFCRSVGMP